MIRPTPSRREFLRELAAGSLGLGAMGSGFARPLLGQPATLSAADPRGFTRLASGRRGVVATVHPLASRAAIEAYQRGGNAIDAAVAASLMLAVVDGHNSGIGGGCLAIVRSADGEVRALDGREKAPRAAQPEMFFRGGQPDPQLSQLGPLAAGVPGLLSALERLASGHGRLSWNESLLGAAEVAENGFQLSHDYARVLAASADKLKLFPSSAAILLDPAGRPWQAGDTLRQSDLARTLRSVAEQGVQWFYEGEFAQRVEQFMDDTGGLLAAADFAQYQTVERQPIRTNYRRQTVIGFPPPSSGGIHHAQMLGMLAGFDVRQIFADSTARGLHLLLEVMKRAMADRAYWLGDADFAKVPRGLLDEDYLRQRAATIDLERSTPVDSHGRPPRADVDLFGQQKHTTHLTTADSQGNVVAITQTVNTSFGCKMIVPGSGVVLNNEMDDFSIAPGVRNAFGLLGSEANLIAPGKRPLSSMSPTLVLDDTGNPMLSCGAAGGPKIITAVLQILVRQIDLGQSLEQALAAPRVHHQWSPDQAVCERSLDDRLVAQLEALGHRTSRIASAAVAQGVSLGSEGLTAAADPRVSSAAMAL
ncbi:MAG: gamma-glutamyltransferase [Planctomycetales bacterium]|nr:gamma-glutamyltransferase [Planctomycetales bacterium]